MSELFCGCAIGGLYVVVVVCVVGFRVVVVEIPVFFVVVAVFLLVCFVVVVVFLSVVVEAELSPTEESVAGLFEVLVPLEDVVSEKITPSSVLFVIAEELFKLLPDSLHEVASPLNSNVQAKINAVILLRFPKNTFLIAVPPSK